MLNICLTGCYTATCRGLTVDYETRRRGSPIFDLARKLLEAGYSPRRWVIATRDERLCIEPIRLGDLAHWTVAEGDNDPRTARFRKYRPWGGGKAGGKAGKNGQVGGRQPRIPEKARGSASLPPARSGRGRALAKPRRSA